MSASVVQELREEIHTLKTLLLAKQTKVELVSICNVLNIKQKTKDTKHELISRLEKVVDDIQFKSKKGKKEETGKNVEMKETEVPNNIKKKKTYTRTELIDICKRNNLSGFQRLSQKKMVKLIEQKTGEYLGLDSQINEFERKRECSICYEERKLFVQCRTCIHDICTDCCYKNLQQSRYNCPYCRNIYHSYIKEMLKRNRLLLSKIDRKDQTAQMRRIAGHQYRPPPPLTYQRRERRRVYAYESDYDNFVDVYESQSDYEDGRLSLR